MKGQLSYSCIYVLHLDKFLEGKSAVVVWKRWEEVDHWCLLFMGTDVLLRIPQKF